MEKYAKHGVVSSAPAVPLAIDHAVLFVPRIIREHWLGLGANGQPIVPDRDEDNAAEEGEAVQADPELAFGDNYLGNPGTDGNEGRDPTAQFRRQGLVERVHALGPKAAHAGIEPLRTDISQLRPAPQP